MSDAMANNTAAPRSARAAALERRSALSRNGRTALGTKPSAPARPAGGPVTTASAPKASTETARPLAAAPAAAGGPVASASGKSLSRARREALSHGGKAALGPARTISSVSNSVPAEVSPLAVSKPAPASDCGCKGKDAGAESERDQAIEEVCSIVENEPASVTGSAASAVRKLCQERRRALSSQGKMAAKFSKIKLPATSGLSGRAAAQARRAELCEKGRNGDQVCRPTGRIRPQVPSKVETGTTLSGNTVSGTQVERTGKVTGGETGSCRAITGTEYIGAEQYGDLCASVPAAAAAKVSVSSTGRGQRVSGIDVDRSVKMTGGESGACKVVTGTEYLSADKFESFCAAKPPLSPAKVGMGVTRGGLNVSGTEEGRSIKVTGDESGACNSKLTGSQYSMDPSASACRNGSGAPHKVTQMSTLKDRVVTGTDVIPGNSVTGSERGACADVTGTESNGLAQYQACNRSPASAPEKIGIMRTWHDQQVSGTSVEHNGKVTGDEYGACQVISGTEYIGPDQYATFCDEERQAASRALMSSRTAMGSLPMSGTRVESGGKVTGAERGENLVLSGSPYAGPHQRVSQRGANSNQHPLTRRPGNGSRENAPEPEPAARVQGDFSIVTPSRSGRESAVNRITGTAYGAIGRITGPVNLAAGLVSGTPEFRYQDGSAVQAPVQPADEARNRLTGDGREGGFAITGAAWRRNESVTGTDGTSTRRNPTIRGEQRGAVMGGASQLKDRERPELPVSRITGSSGNDSKGSAITYSGGARG